MNKEILKIALDTKNLSFLPDHTHFTKLKNKMCGDEIKIYLVVRNGKILNFKYEGESCIYCQASASLLSENILRKTIGKIEILLNESYNRFQNKKKYPYKDWDNFFKIINKRNVLRKDCLLLPIKATLKALKK